MSYTAPSLNIRLMGRFPVAARKPPSPVPWPIELDEGWLKSIRSKFREPLLKTMMVSWGASRLKNGMKSLSQCHLTVNWRSGSVPSPPREKRAWTRALYLNLLSFY